MPCTFGALSISLYALYSTIFYVYVVRTASDYRALCAHIPSYTYRRVFMAYIGRNNFHCNGSTYISITSQSHGHVRFTRATVRSAFAPQVIEFLAASVTIASYSILDGTCILYSRSNCPSSSTILSTERCV